MSELIRLSNGQSITGQVVRVYGVTYEANGAGTCELRLGSTTGTVLATLRLAAAGSVSWRAGDPDGVAVPGDLFVVLTLGTVSISHGVQPARVVEIDSPLQLPGLLVWYDFQDPSNVFKDDGITPVSADDDLVYRVNDKSGNGNHLLSGAEPNRPFYKTNSWGGHPAVRTTEGNETLTKTPTHVQVAQPVTYFLAVRWHNLDNIADHEPVMDGPAGFRSAPVMLDSGAGTARRWITWYGNLLNGIDDADTYQHVWCAVADSAGGGNITYKDGVALPSASVAGAGTAGFGGVYLGRNLDNSNFVPIDYGQIFVCQGALSKALRNAGGRYLARLNGLRWADIT